MTDSNATERICELLTERGIEYKLRRASGTSARETVFWEYQKDGEWATVEYAVTVPMDGYGTLEASHLTPEQAVAATLGWIEEPDTIRNELADGGLIADVLAPACVDEKEQRAFERGRVYERFAQQIFKEATS